MTKAAGARPNVTRPNVTRPNVTRSSVKDHAAGAADKAATGAAHRDNFDYLSPLDTRYYGDDREVYAALHPYLSEAAVIGYQIKVEQAIVASLEEAGVAPRGISARMAQAGSRVTPAAVYEEEHRTHHNIRALVNCLAAHLPEADRGFVHLFATSADIMDTARSLALRDLTRDVLLPELCDLITVLIEEALRYAELPQIGRTHGRFAEPITVGYWLANFIARLTARAEKIASAAKELRGMFSGAVGAHSALALAWPDDPAAMELDVLDRLGLKPGQGAVSTQIIQPEYVVDYAHALTSTFGVLANIADDFRHLMRSEIAEAGEDLDTHQVGSSTMPHKINPKNFENVKSLWKAFVPRIMTVYMDQVSEHQRDLTNSASMRFFNELVAGTFYAIRRLKGALKKTRINPQTTKQNLERACEQLIEAEPLYIAFALTGHPGGYYKARELVLKARESGSDLLSLLETDPEARNLWARVPEERKAVIRDPARYVGDSAARTRMVCEEARGKLDDPSFLRQLDRPDERRTLIVGG
jgi:adenylosuccinate lyase